MGVTSPPGFWLSNRKKQPEVWELMVVSTRFLASGWILYEELLANPSAILEGIFETKITGEWRVCDLTQSEQEAKEKTKKSQSGHAEVALGEACRGSQEMNNATGTYIFTENCPEAQAILTFSVEEKKLDDISVEIFGSSKVRIEDQTIATKPGDLFQKCPED